MAFVKVNNNADNSAKDAPTEVKIVAPEQPAEKPEVPEVPEEPKAPETPAKEETSATVTMTTVAPAPAKAVNVTIKTVKIRMLASHTCNIGGEYYALEKDKTYSVPENVKRILLKAGLLQPLE